VHAQLFLGMLDENNSGYIDLVSYFQESDSDEEIFVFAKDEGVNSIPLPTKTRTPLFDKKLAIVFIIPQGFHENITATLWGYHNDKEGCCGGYKRGRFASQYLKDDLGWYVGSVKCTTSQEFCVETSQTYIFDEFDKSYLSRIGPYKIRTGLKI
jgi:hypothetical protein